LKILKEISMVPKKISTKSRVKKNFFENEIPFFLLFFLALIFQIFIFCLSQPAAFFIILSSSYTFIKQAMEKTLNKIQGLVFFENFLSKRLQVFNYLKTSPVSFAHSTKSSSFIGIFIFLEKFLILLSISRYFLFERVAGISSITPYIFRFFKMCLYP